MKFSRITLFAFFLGMAGLFFWGCGGGGGGSSTGGTIANPALGNLTGRILQGPPQANIVGVRGAEVVGTTGVAGAEVWLEERPDIRTRTGLDGTFVFADIPEGSYRVVAKFESGLTVLKARSASTVTVLKATSVTIDLTLQPATVRVTGVLRGTNGQPLPTGTKLTLWGETFEIQTGGRFETPPLPEGFFDNEIIIAFAGTSSSFSVPVTFVAAQSPASVDFMVPFGGGTPAGPWHHPPVVSISAKNGTTLTSRVDAGGPLTITAVARDAGDLDRVVPTWNTTRGTLTETADRYVRIWNAPATGGLATVSVLVTDGEGATGTVWLPLLVEGNLSSEKSLTAFSFGTPAVTGTIDQTARTIAVTVPFGTDLSALVPTITHSGASVLPVSGQARNFTSPVTYTVTAADSSTQVYVVTVTVPPTCVLSTTAPNPTNAAIPVTVTFDKDVTGFDIADVVVVNGTKSLFANLTPNRVWTLTVTPTAGAVTVDVAANAAQDGAGNGNTVATQLARTYDAVPPVCVLSTTAPNPTNAAIPVTVTFDKDVTGFDIADVVVVNGTKSLFANPTPNRVWTLTVTPTAGAVTVDVAANAAQDGAGNGNPVATPLARTYDSVVPSVVLSDNHPDAIVLDANTVIITADFTENEAIDEVNKPKITIGSVVSSVDMTKVGGDNKQWQYTWDVPAGNDGNAAVTITARDVAGNICSAATGKTSYTIDNTAPTMVISSTRGSPTTNLTPIPVTITFNEAVTGFSVAGVTVGNGTLSNFTGVSGTEYTFDLTITGNGHPTVDVSANGAQDAAGNNNTAATQYTHQVSGADGTDVTIDGSCYILVPRYTLPGGTVVPAFYCGKYAATAGVVNAAGATYVNNGTFQPLGDGTVRQAATTAEGWPWVILNWNDAKLACSAAGCALISEDQWLSIAHQTLGVSANWLNGTIGSTVAGGGGFYRGLSNNTVTKGQPASGGDAGANPLSTSIEYRIKKLPNNAQVWDIGGNVWQCVDKLQAANTWYTGFNASGWFETNNVNFTTTKIKTTYDSTYGVGQIYNSSTTSDRALSRGGSWFHTVSAGAFALALSYDPAYTNNNFGFRCTRP